MTNISFSTMSSTQYVTAAKCLVIDEQPDLFQPFHSLTVNAMKSVSAACSHMLSSETKSYNRYLRQWLNCEFSGKESFEEVQAKIVPKVTTIGDYIDFICKVTQLRTFLFVHENNHNYATVSFNMSFETFDKFNQSTNFDVEQEHVLCESEKRTSLVRENSPMFCDVDEERELDVGAGGDNDSAETERYIDKMYQYAQELADEGNQGEGLDPPKEIFACLSCYDKEDFYMEAEFRNSDTNDTFKKWITRNQAIKVIISVFISQRFLRFVS